MSHLAVGQLCYKFEQNSDFLNKCNKITVNLSIFIFRTQSRNNKYKSTSGQLEQHVEPSSHNRGSIFSPELLFLFRNFLFKKRDH